MVLGSGRIWMEMRCLFVNRKVFLIYILNLAILKIDLGNFMSLVLTVDSQWVLF